MLDVEQVAQDCPQEGGELGPPVQCDDSWDPKSAHPSLKQSISAVYCCGGEYLPAEIPGHQGGNIPVMASPMRSRTLTFCVTICKPGLKRSVYTCGQRIWRRAISLRSGRALTAMAAQTWRAS